MKDWQFYVRYGTEVNIQTGEIKLPISNCGKYEKDGKCHHIISWEKDGCPTNLEKTRFDRFKFLLERKEKANWVFYDKYDTSVNVETGEIKLPIRNCESNGKCHHILLWEKEGCPTHMSKLDLRTLRQFAFEDWVFYDKYDTSVNIKTGEIKMPNCECAPEDECYYLKLWEEEGCPTHLNKEELDKFLNEIDEMEKTTPGSNLFYTPSVKIKIWKKFEDCLDFGKKEFPYENWHEGKTDITKVVRASEGMNSGSFNWDLTSEKAISKKLSFKYMADFFDLVNKSEKIIASPYNQQLIYIPYREDNSLKDILEAASLLLRVILINQTYSKSNYVYLEDFFVDPNISVELLEKELNRILPSSLIKDSINIILRIN
jgi:hypothetical protein